jgi:hypothetical protein
VHVEHLAILERVEDDSKTYKLLCESVQRTRTMRARVREPATGRGPIIALGARSLSRRRAPDSYAITEELLPLARNAELECRGHRVGLELLLRPDASGLGLTVRGHARKVPVHFGRARRLPRVGEGPVARVGIDLVEGWLE